MAASRNFAGIGIWASTTVVLGGATLFALLGPARHVVWVSPTALFLIVTVAAGLCVVAAGWVLVVAHRRNIAEVGLLGAGLMAVSVLPLVHGLTAPGVLYGPNAAVRSSVFLALPAGLVAMAPLLAAKSSFGRWAGRHWRWWSGTFALGSVAIAAALLVWPDAYTAPRNASPVVIAIVVIELAATLRLSWLQLRLYEVGRRPSTLFASLSLVLLAVTSLVWLGGPAFGVGWWLVHALDIIGVFGACVGVIRSHRLGHRTIDVLTPILTIDPLAALEIGLAPVVHRFVAALEAKDPITRDHVVRTASLAVRTGERLGLGPRRLRNLGLAALLHDIGKLDTPDAVLTKSGRLTEDEYSVVQRHTVDGEAMVASVRSLAPIAPFVRSHHERIDGTGYPDALSGDAIPIEARIIAACDGFDAMAHTRQYRVGMGVELASSILREHAGSQWDRHVVAQVLAVVAQVATTTELSSAGRATCECADALPESVQRQLLSQI